MKQKKSTQVLALIALLAILLGVIGTGINFFLSMNQEPKKIELTPEQLEGIKADLNAQLEEKNNADNNTEKESTENK